MADRVGDGTHARPAFTLIVPTFNRPPVLAQLLTYLARHKAGFPVLVLDSSDDEAKTANAALVERVGLELDVRLLRFESSITPFEKFWRGSEEVQTDFCSLCADDDVVMINAISPLVQFLQEHADVSAAHGLYFTFYVTDHIGITSIVYAGRSFDEDSGLARFIDLFRHYEAVTYAVYRTGVMRQVLKAVLPMRSMLVRELLGGALTVAAGKVARLPIIYYGRSLGPSGLYQHWHPIDFLVSSPQELFEDYARCRAVVFESLTRSGARSGASADVLKIIDLAHLRYLTDFTRPAMLDYVIDQVVAGAPKDDIMQGVWPRLAPSTPISLGARVGSTPRRARRLLVRLLSHRLGWSSGGGLPARRVEAITFGGRPREYRVFDAFSSALQRADTPRAAALVAGMLQEMNAYE